jgi:hypothetical protein
MRITAGILATDGEHTDGSKTGIAFLQTMVENHNSHYSQMLWNHDLRFPPVGRIRSARVVKLPDGHSGVAAEMEEYEDTDTPASIHGDGRTIELYVRDVPLFAVAADLTFDSDGGREVLDRLGRITGAAGNDLYWKRGADAGVSTLVITSGLFMFGAIVVGFLERLGADLYERFRRALTEYFGNPGLPKNGYVDFRFFVRKDETDFDYHLLVDNRNPGDLAELLSTRFEGLDDLIADVPISEAGLGRVVAERVAGRLVLRYAVRKDAVPLEFSPDGGLLDQVARLPPAERSAKERATGLSGGYIIDPRGGRGSVSLP